MNKSSRLSLYFWIFLALNLAYIAWSRSYLEPLTSGDIIRFEVAKTVPKAEGILADWAGNGKLEKAKKSLYVDYIFIVLYSGLLITGILLLARLSRHVLLLRMGRFVAMLIPIAAVCDVVENIAMSRSLSGKLTSFHVTLAYDMAVAKFSIIIIACIFLFVCLLFWVGSHVKPKPSYTLM